MGCNKGDNMTKYLKDNEDVCKLCNKIANIKDMHKFIVSYMWGSFSGTKNYQKCCKECYESKIITGNKKGEEYRQGEVKGRAYA